MLAPDVEETRKARSGRCRFARIAEATPIRARRLPVVQRRHLGRRGGDARSGARAEPGSVERVQQRLQRLNWLLACPSPGGSSFAWQRALSPPPPTSGGGVTRGTRQLS